MGEQAAALDQEAGGVLWWLKRFAAGAASRYRFVEPTAGWAEFWSAQAAATAELLEELAREGTGGLA